MKLTNFFGSDSKLDLCSVNYFMACDLEYPMEKNKEAIYTDYYTSHVFIVLSL